MSSATRTSPPVPIPALAHVVRIDRNDGAIHDGGSFPGAGSLAIAGGYLWVATAPSPGVPSSEANILYRLNALTLVVEQRTSIAGLTTAGNFEPPALTAAGNVLWIGYGPHVARLSATTGATVWGRSLGGTGSVTSLSVDPTGRLIYAGFDGDRPSIAELNATTGATVALTSAYYGFDLGGPKLAAFVGDVWVAYATGMDGTNVELGASNLIPRAGGVDGLHTNGLNVFRGNGILWMSDFGELFCADQATGAIRATINDVPFGTLIASELGGHGRGWTEWGVLPSAQPSLLTRPALAGTASCKKAGSHGTDGCLSDDAGRSGVTVLAHARGARD